MRHVDECPLVLGSCFLINRPRRDDTVTSGQVTASEIGGALSFREAVKSFCPSEKVSSDSSSFVQVVLPI